MNKKKFMHQVFKNAIACTPSESEVSIAWATWPLAMKTRRSLTSVAKLQALLCTAEFQV